MVATPIVKKQQGRFARTGFNTLNQSSPAFDCMVSSYDGSPESAEYHIQCWSRVWYDEKQTMETARKITVEVPLELLRKARRASGTGITQTVRTGLQLVAASRTYARLRQLRGKVRFTRTLAELKADR